MGLTHSYKTVGFTFTFAMFCTIFYAICIGARRHGQEGALAPSGNVVKCVRAVNKTLSRRIVYALFSQPVVDFWGLRPQTPTGAPSLDHAGDFRPQTHQTPNLPTPGKKILRVPMAICMTTCL